MGTSLMLASRRRISPLLVELPQFVAVAVVPLTGGVVALVLEPDLANHRSPLAGSLSQPAKYRGEPPISTALNHDQLLACWSLASQHFIDLESNRIV
jgi:hypothetical protein